MRNFQPLERKKSLTFFIPAEKINIVLLNCGILLDNGVARCIIASGVINQIAKGFTLNQAGDVATFPAFRIFSEKKLNKQKIQNPA